MNAPSPAVGAPAPAPPAPSGLSTGTLVVLCAVLAAVAYRFVTSRDDERKALRDVDKYDRELREMNPDAAVFWEE